MVNKYAYICYILGQTKYFAYRKFKYICYVAKIFFIYFWILFVMGLEQIPEMNLQISISAKVDNIMNKIAEYSLIDQTFANFLLF